jgi:hypothetical protein
MRILEIHFTKAGGARLRGAGQRGLTYSIHASKDLKGWSQLGETRGDDAGQFEFTDAHAGRFQTRFYRVAAAPVD